MLGQKKVWPWVVFLLGANAILSTKTRSRACTTVFMRVYHHSVKSLIENKFSWQDLHYPHDNDFFMSVFSTHEKLSSRNLHFLVAYVIRVF